jgi:hypothetical protein
MMVNISQGERRLKPEVADGAERFDNLRERIIFGPMIGDLAHI